MKQKLLLFIILTGLCQFFFASPVFAKKVKVYTQQDQIKYEKKVLAREAKKEYKKSLLPQSGYMTREEYEELSKDISNSEREIPEYKFPKDIKMKYVPQPTYKLVHYNDPPGSPELHLARKILFDRQENGKAITSPQKDILVYPTVYYYVNNQCTAGDLFVIPLDKTLPEVERVLRANVIKRNPDPILSTPKEITQKFTFRTITPVDFSADGTKLIAKEKIGNIDDGIWKTNLWVYDFKTQTAKQIPEIRDAIKFYWMNQEGLVLDEKRWDIYPLGFDAENPDRVIVSAYGYTGKAPKFLGNWSIDCQGEKTLLISLFRPEAKISVNGLKIEQSGIINPAEVYNNEKQQNKELKKKRKAANKTKKEIKKQKKQAYHKKLKEIKAEELSTLNAYKQKQKLSAPTGTE